MTRLYALFILSILCFPQVEASQYGSPMAQNPNIGNGYDNGEYANDEELGGENPPAGYEQYPDNDLNDLQPPLAGRPGYGPYNSAQENSYPEQTGIREEPTQYAPQEYSPAAPRINQNGSSPGREAPNPSSTSFEKQQQKLKGMDYIRQLQNALLEGNKENLCGENGVCRKSFGEGCQSSKNFLSVCATVCSDYSEFRGSHCINEGAKRYHMNAQTYVYDARPKKQKKAESVVQHISVQLREGRKALREDKRLFFNTFCTPPSMNMIPEHDRKPIELACLDFLYNGYPPASALNKVMGRGEVTPQPAPPVVVQAPPPPPQQEDQPEPAANDNANTGDDVNAPMGGLEADQGEGDKDDKGAEYSGDKPPIIEDKVSSSDDEDCDEPVKKKQKSTIKKKSKHKKKAKPKKKAVPQKKSKQPPPPPPVADEQADGSEESNSSDDQAQDDAQTSGKSKKASTDQQAQDDQDANSNSSDDTQTDEEQAADAQTDNGDQAKTKSQDQSQNQQQAEPKKKDDSFLGELGGAGGLSGLMSKLTKKKGGGKENKGDKNAGDDSDSDGGKSDDSNNKVSSAFGKFLKF